MLEMCEKNMKSIVSSLKALRFNIMACDTRNHSSDIIIINNAIEYLEEFEP